MCASAPSRGHRLLFHDNPVRSRPITSLFDLPTSSEEDDELAVLLRRDLATLLGKLHRFARRDLGADHML